MKLFKGVLPFFFKEDRRRPASTITESGFFLRLGQLTNKDVAAVLQRINDPPSFVIRDPKSIPEIRKHIFLQDDFLTLKVFTVSVYVPQAVQLPGAGYFQALIHRNRVREKQHSTANDHRHLVSADHVCRGPLAHLIFHFDFDELRRAYYGNITVLTIPQKQQIDGFLSSHPTPLFDSNDAMGDATFLQNRGKNPILYSIAPEVYRHASGALNEIEKLFDPDLDNIEKREHRKLLHDCVVARLNGTPLDLPAALYPFFAELESLLERAVPNLAQHHSLSFKELLQADKISTSDGKHFGLGSWLKLVSRILKLKGDGETQVLVGDWEDLVGVRNIVMHGGEMSDGAHVIRVLLKQLPRVYSLERYIARQTGPVEGDAV